MEFLVLIAKKARDLGTKAPEWFQLFPRGEILIEDDQPAVMDEDAANLILKSLAERTTDMVIDYEHQTLTGGEAPAAGWIQDIEWRGEDGLWVKSKWTEKAAGYIEAEEYRYFSPVCLVRKTDRRIVALYNVSLTNQPRIKNLSALVAKHQPKLDHERRTPMWEKLKKLLGLADDAGEDKAFEAVEALIAKNTELEKSGGGTTVVACKSILDELKLDGEATEEQVLKAIGGLSAAAPAAADLAKTVTDLQNRIAAMEQEDMTALALKNGQISPDELDKWGKDLALKNPEQFKVIVLSRPRGSVVPIDKLKDEPAGRQQKIGDETLLVAKMLGVTKEDIEKYGA